MAIFFKLVKQQQQKQIKKVKLATKQLMYLATNLILTQNNFVLEMNCLQGYRAC